MRLVHEYVAQKLNAKMSEFIPVTEATKFELVNNFKSANVLGLITPPILLIRVQKGIRRQWGEW